MDRQRWNKLTQLFHEASSLKMGKRREFLDRACGTDVRLRTQVERLLSKTDSEDDGRLAGPADLNV